jgi:hypothetical protein
MEWRDPRTLLCIDRLDVFLKKLYFDVIGGLRSRDADLIVCLYRKHIAIRTGGVEPPDSFDASHHVAKKSVDDYETCARQLLQSVRQHGFRVEFAIPISTNLRLTNGAHRLAVAISLDLPQVPIVPLGDGGQWGIEWFRTHFSRKEFLFLLNEYSALRQNSAPVVLWGMAEEYLADVKASFAAKGLLAEKVHEVDLKHNFDGFCMLIHELYGVPLRQNDNIRRKAIIHGAYSRRFSVLHVEPAPALEPVPGDFFETLSGAKVTVRESLDSRIPKDVFLTVHTPSALPEKRHMQHLLYSPASLRFYRYYQYVDDAFHEAFMLKLNELKRYLGDKAHSADSVCLVKSGVLGACGIRMPNDMDFITASRRFSKSDLRESIGDGTSGILVDTMADYSVNVPTLSVSTSELLEDSKRHFLFHGIKFADLNHVYVHKSICGRPHDRDDLVRVRKHIRKARKAIPSRFLREELLWLETGVRQGFQ